MGAAYDVFVSFKNTDKNGRATRDSVLAKLVYDHLTMAKLRVFYSNSSLQQRGVSAFMQAISDALESAKVLVAVAASAANLFEPYVKEEWETFLVETLSGRKPDGRIFVYAENIAIGALPLPFRKREMIEHQATGALERLRDFIANAKPSGPIQDLEPKARLAIRKATELARRQGFDLVQRGHLFAGVMQAGAEIAEQLLGGNLAALRRRVALTVRKSLPNPPPPQIGPPLFSKGTMEVLTVAAQLAGFEQSIDLPHLWKALVLSYGFVDKMGKIVPRLCDPALLRQVDRLLGKGPSSYKYDD